MGPCAAKSGNQQTMQKASHVKVGGEQDGVCIWKQYNGKPVVTEERQLGWEMKFNVDEHGVISGSNKNDVEGAKKKTYTGHFKDGKLSCQAAHEDGSIIKYEGIAEGATMKLTCTVIKESDDFVLGDFAECTGKITYN